MEGLVQQLFGFLGGLLTTCSSDAPLLRGGPSLPMAPRPCWPRGQGPPAPLSSLSFRPRGEAAGPATGVPDGHAQQYAGRGGGGTAARAAPAGPVARPRERAHQCPAACRGARGRAVWGGCPPRLPRDLGYAHCIADCRARKAQLDLSLAVSVPRPWQTIECPTLRTQTWAASWRSWP